MFRLTDLCTRVLCVVMAFGAIAACNDAPESPTLESNDAPAAEHPPVVAQGCEPYCEPVQCAPVCSVAQCAQDDSCSGACGACPAAWSCDDCPLLLSVVETRVVDGLIREVVVALDYQPEENDARPALADLRFVVEGGEPVSVALAPTVLDAGKVLHVDPETGRPFRMLADGTVRLLVFSTSSSTRIPGGRWLFLKVRAPYGADGSVPIAVSLVEREAIFAPADADLTLSGGGFGAPISVWLTEGNDVP